MYIRSNIEQGGLFLSFFKTNDLFAIFYGKRKQECMKKLFRVYQTIFTLQVWSRRFPPDVLKGVLLLLLLELGRRPAVQGEARRWRVGQQRLCPTGQTDSTAASAAGRRRSWWRRRQAKVRKRIREKRADVEGRSAAAAIAAVGCQLFQVRLDPIGWRIRSVMLLMLLLCCCCCCCCC